MNNIDFISLYHTYINNFVDNIKITDKYKLDDLEKKKLFNNFIGSPFISNELKDKLSKKMNKNIIYDYVYSMKINKQIINFHFISDKNYKIISHLKNYYFFIIFLQLNANKNCIFTENIYINIIPLNISKKISVPITINDINSASTVIYNDYFGGPIYIWRSDEIEKVLIHETLHSLQYDYDIINQKLVPSLKKLEEKIDKNGKGLNINEAYTELCATFIMCLFKIGKNSSKKEAKKILKNELKKVLEHSLQTCGKLFGKYKISDIEQCTNVDKIEGCGYHQEAGAFSYIVIKTALLWTIMKNCKSKIKKYTDKIECLEEFLGIGFAGKIGLSYQNMVIKILKNEKFIDAIKKHIKKQKGRPGNLYFTIFR